MKEEVNGMHALINEHKNYLSKTDYKVIKESETGELMDDNVKEARQHARDEIKRLDYQISILEEEIEQIEENIDKIISPQ